MATAVCVTHIAECPSRLSEASNVDTSLSTVFSAQVLRRCADFLIPRLMGFDEVIMAGGGGGAPAEENGQM